VLETVMYVEFAINGFRNRDLRMTLFGTPFDDNKKSKMSTTKDLGSHVT